jgi:hypothetical protein
VTTRRPIPELFESAKSARARGCRVADNVVDDASVVAIHDEYPRLYKWTIWWSTGIRDGVRQHGDPPAPKEPPCLPLRPLGKHCGTHGFPLYPSGVCRVTVQIEQIAGVRASIAAWLISSPGGHVIAEAYRGAGKGERVAAIGAALAAAVLDRRDLRLEVDDGRSARCAGEEA